MLEQNPLKGDWVYDNMPFVLAGFQLRNVKENKK